LTSWAFAGVVVLSKQRGLTPMSNKTVPAADIGLPFEAAYAPTAAAELVARYFAIQAVIYSRKVHDAQRSAACDEQFKILKCLPHTKSQNTEDFKAKLRLALHIAGDTSSIYFEMDDFLSSLADDYFHVCGLCPRIDAAA
jgi:hypothetical protein